MSYAKVEKISFSPFFVFVSLFCWQGIWFELISLCSAYRCMSVPLHLLESGFTDPVTHQEIVAVQAAYDTLKDDPSYEAYDESYFYSVRTEESRFCMRFSCS